MDDRLVREAAGPEHRGLPRNRGPHLRVGPSGAQRVSQLRGALGEPDVEHGRVLVGVTGEVAEMVVREGLRRPGPDDRLDPAVAAAEVPQQLAEVPVRKASLTAALTGTC